MTAINPALGRLAVVPPREVWPHEALDFTPWLLKNVDVLSDLLGMDLALGVAEHPVGDFSLDLKGSDETTGEVVIVENQLEISDHTHLGQILTYAAGTNPTTIVWVAAGFRPEHRAAIDWLNARTDESTRFFGVEIGVVRIGDSIPAPAFKLVAQPNDWEKTVRSGTAKTELSGKQGLYSEFWRQWLDLIHGQRPGWSRAKRTTVAAWLPMTSGQGGVTYYTSLTRNGAASELNFESPHAGLNSERFERLLARKEEFEAAYGAPLLWQPLPGRKSARVADLLPGADITSEADWPTYLNWYLDTQTRRAAIAAIGGMDVVL